MALSEALSLHTRIRTKRAHLELQECAGDEMVSWGCVKVVALGTLPGSVSEALQGEAGQGWNYPAAVQWEQR